MAEIQVSLPDELLQEFDQAAEAEQRSRSDIFSEAAQHYLTEKTGLHRWEDQAVLHALAVQDRLAREDRDEYWDPIGEIRRMRESRR